MTPEEYIDLYQKYIAGESTEDERNALFAYKDSFQMQDSTSLADQKKLRGKIYKNILHTLSSTRTVTRIPWWGRYAATVALILSIGIYFYVRDTDKGQPVAVLQGKSESMTRGLIDSSTVTLTLSNGAAVALDGADNGLLSANGVTGIKKLNQNEIQYDESKNIAFGVPATNKLYVPKGGQYRLTLADGTKVWLNANSTLSYPLAFKGLNRTVELSGEAYFEVAKNEKMPFVVTTKSATVQVLGTHFNISAYSDDNVEKTTLIEGLVKVLRNDKELILSPGEQSVVRHGQSDILLKKVDIRQALAWKDGLFVFKDNTLDEVMKQIARWYDMEVEYRGTPKENLIGGLYSKSKGLDELLKGLELTGVYKFKIEGRRIIVMD